ncbi:ABC transporter substrate-binding protein [Georgenia alba]|uniref:ABC transporter substrate-binding protein n=1 Tax=Georgenia alba TaxID=2233858 RepID=A0ABW2Q657_9MICO
MVNELWSPPGANLSRAGFLRGSGLLLAAAAGGGLLGACAEPGSGQGQAAAGGDGEGTDFTFLSYLTLDTLSMSPEMLGLAGGYFADHGLNTEVQVVRGSPQALQTLLSGVAPLTRVGAIDLMTARTEQDQPLVNVGTIVRRPSIRIIYSQDRPLAAPEDFVGKTIGVPSEGGTSEKTLMLMLQNSGIDPEQVTRQVVAQTPASFEMVRRGQLDGYMGSIDIALMVESTQEGGAILNPADIAAVKADTQIYVTTEEAIEQHGDDLRSYLAAIREAVTSIVEDSDRSRTIETLRGEYSFATLDDDEVAPRALDEGVALWTDDGNADELLVTDTDLWVEAVAELEEAGFISGAEDPESWVDNSLLEQ